MGVDIHTYIVKDGNLIAKDIYTGRNSRWFDNINDRAIDPEYNHFPAKYGLPENLPDEAKTDTEYCYGFNHIKVGDFIEWFKKYRPHVKAGWAHKYDVWAYENKGYILDVDELIRYPEPDEIAGLEFVTVENKYEPSLYLFNYFYENKIDMEAYFVYWFDH